MFSPRPGQCLLSEPLGRVAYYTGTHAWIFPSVRWESRNLPLRLLEALGRSVGTISPRRAQGGTEAGSPWAPTL